MTNFTDAQKDAINKNNTSIIVSAGAGSGKTTVLKERVLRILKEGHNINELIILTFTKNAAAEMKERIRKIIQKNDDVKDMLEYLDTAYITTFDSYANSLVKKYSYLLNISDDFIIVDDNIVKTKISDFIDEIFEDYYENSIDFQNMIRDFELKNDEDIRDSIKKIYNNLNKLENKKEFLNTYLEKYYNNDYIKKLFEQYEEYIFQKRDEIIEQIELLNNECDEETRIFNETTTSNFINAISYDELSTCDFKLKQKKGENYSEEGLLIKKNIASLREELNKSLKKGVKKELIDQYKSTQKYAKVIIEILLNLDKKVMEYKQKHNAYEFQDIELLAIDLLEKNENIKNEIKNNTFEIMIDEYQDTNDIQEKFVSLIEKNNVYMVGDIKQSIYRFRNANPYIFKNKYDKYKNEIGGYKIDLKENFRSRKEVIENINLIFENYMFNEIGGANYKQEHEMIYGNKKYLDFNINKDYNLKIYNYEKNGNYTDVEQEGFIIANDIINRIKNKEQIVYEENDEYKHRDITYKDFVILIDKSKYFEDLKKILEANNIPTTIDKSISIKEEDEIYILKNIINIIICIKNNNYNKDFKHSYMSIARSYLYNMNDEDLFKIITNETYKETEIFLKCAKIVNIIDSKSNKEIITTIINDFDIVNKIININNVNERITKLEYFIKNANSLNDFGLNIYKLNEYFDEIINGDNDIKMDINTTGGNTVKIMTIHGSKGLEYPIVYTPFLNSNFFKTSNTELMTYSNTNGLIIPFYDNGKGNTIAYTLDKYYEKKEIISEKIRLFYVALTRAKEKFVIINQINDKIQKKDIINQNDLLKYQSYSDFINALSLKLNKYIEIVNIDTLNINKDINEIKINNYKDFINKSNIKLNTKKINIDNEYLENKHFSKILNKLIDKDLKKNLNYGTYMHYVFEVCNFKNYNVNDLNIDEKDKEKIINFLNHDETKNIKNAKIYKEHEIKFDKDGSTYHGFIDLLLEYEDHFDIIDYKLSNINSPEYKIQLNGYKDYIEKTFNKKTNIYLYSIKKDQFKKL